jgi:hypothetical protein
MKRTENDRLHPEILALLWWTACIVLSVVSPPTGKCNCQQHKAKQQQNVPYAMMYRRSSVDSGGTHWFEFTGGMINSSLK